MEPTDHRLAAVMFTDIVGFSRMMEEDEKGTLQTLDFHNQLVREQVSRFRGTVIKTIGDAFLAQFSTTLDAVQCSIAVQDGIRGYNDAHQGKPLTLRIGVHLGDIYFYENDALGEGINIASRLQSMTTPGRITISREVYGQVSGKLPMRVEALGQVHLKNISREVHAYEIIPGGEDNNSPSFRQAHQSHPEPESPRPAGPPPSFRELRDEWKSIKRQVRDEVRRALDPANTFEAYKAKKLRKAQKAGAGFRGHLIPFVVVNAFLAFINLTFSPTKLWFLIPLCGWGIGLLSHAGAVLAARRTARDLKPLDRVTDEEFGSLKRSQDARTGFYGHLFSNLGIAALLLVIWQISGTSFPWPLIPIAVLALGLVSRARSLAIGRPGPALSRTSSPTAVAANPAVAKASSLRDSIVAQAEGWKGGNPLGTDVAGTLDHYVRQITELSAIEQELSRVVATFRPEELDAEEASLQKKVTSSPSDALRREYEKSLAEIDRQRKGFADLAEQQEILNLRIKSALGNLQQMQVDLARIKGLSDAQPQSSLVSIKVKSEELSRYLDDYREGFKEIPE